MDEVQSTMKTTRDLSLAQREGAAAQKEGSDRQNGRQRPPKGTGPVWWDKQNRRALFESHEEATQERPGAVCENLPSIIISDQRLCQVMQIFTSCQNL